MTLFHSHMYDLTTATPCLLVVTLLTHAADISQVAFNPADPNMLVSLDLDGCLCVWDIKSMTHCAVVGGDDGVGGKASAAAHVLVKETGVTDISTFAFVDPKT